MIEASGNSIRAELSATLKFDGASIVGKAVVSVPYNGTSTGAIQSEAPSGAQVYMVTVAEGTVETDDGGDPTIIIDD